jgi:hypothetical protein
MNESSLRNRQGTSLVVVIFVLLILSLLGLNLISLANNELKISDRYGEDVKAFYIAEGGLERAFHEIKLNQDFNSAYWLDILKSDHTLGDGKYKLAIAEVEDGIIKITSTGKAGLAHHQLIATVQFTDTNQNTESGEPDDGIRTFKVIFWEDKGALKN